MAITLGKSNTPANGSANTTKVLKVPAARIDEFIEQLNAQFPDLVEGEKPAYACNYAFTTDPKGNVTIWQATKGVHSVTLTGALTAISF